MAEKKKTRRKRVHVKGHTRGSLWNMDIVTGKGGPTHVKPHDRMIQRKRKKK